MIEWLVKAKAKHKANTFNSLDDILENWETLSHNDLKWAFDKYSDVQRGTEEWDAMFDD